MDEVTLLSGFSRNGALEPPAFERLLRVVESPTAGGLPPVSSADQWRGRVRWRERVSDPLALGGTSATEPCL